MLQCLSRYPTSVRVFRDPILFLAGLKPSWEHGQQRPAIMAGEKKMAFKNFIYTKDDDDLDFLPKEPSQGFGIGSPYASVNTEPPKDVKKPEVQPAEASCEEETSLRVIKFSSKDDALFLSISDDDEGLPDCFELKDANACHLKISAITPPAWKGIWIIKWIWNYLIFITAVMCGRLWWIMQLTGEPVSFCRLLRR
ncbi:hypothetical protein Tco_0095011 [Tanacetum coccineum]